MSHVAAIKKEKVSVSEQIESKIRILDSYCNIYDVAETANGIASGFKNNRNDSEAVIKALDCVVSYLSDKSNAKPEARIPGKKTETEIVKEAVAKLNIDFSCIAADVKNKDSMRNLPYSNALMINYIHQAIDEIKIKREEEYKDCPELERMALKARGAVWDMNRVFPEKIPENLKHEFKTLFYHLPDFIRTTAENDVFQGVVKVALTHLSSCAKILTDPINNQVSAKEFARLAEKTQDIFRQLVPEFKNDRNDSYSEITECDAYKAYKAGLGGIGAVPAIDNFYESSQEIGTMKDWLVKRHEALHEALEKAGYSQEKSFSKTA